MKKIVVILSIFTLLTGCATVTVVESNGSYQERIGKSPSIGSESLAPVGSQIFSQFKYWSKTGFRLKEGYSAGLALGSISVVEGDFILKSTLEDRAVFCTEKRAYIDPLVGPFATVCFIDVGDTGKFSKVTARPGAIWFENNIASPIAYERSELITPKQDSFKYELLYQGVSKGPLKLSYREYVNDMARPSYFQDVAYDIAAYPAIVTFKTVRLNILSADNNEVKYVVLSGF